MDEKRIQLGRADVKQRRCSRETGRSHSLCAGSNLSQFYVPGSDRIVVKSQPCGHCVARAIPGVFEECDTMGFSTEFRGALIAHYVFGRDETWGH